MKVGNTRVTVKTRRDEVRSLLVFEIDHCPDLSFQEKRRDKIRSERPSTMASSSLPVRTKAQIKLASRACLVHHLASYLLAFDGGINCYQPELAPDLR